MRIKLKNTLINTETVGVRHLSSCKLSLTVSSFNTHRQAAHSIADIHDKTVLTVLPCLTVFAVAAVVKVGVLSLPVPPSWGLAWC